MKSQFEKHYHSTARCVLSGIIRGTASRESSPGADFTKVLAMIANTDMHR